MLYSSNAFVVILTPCSPLPAQFCEHPLHPYRMPSAVRCQGTQVVIITLTPPSLPHLFLKEKLQR